MIHTGDCIEVMRGMDAETVDAIVTDPPYGLEFMGKGWDKFGAVVEHPDDGEGPWGRTSRVRYAAGHSFQAWCEAWGREALRVTRPGGYLLAFGGTRTHHRLVCGLEDAGWIIRDELDWIYASGFPKGKANLKPAHEPIVLARKPGPLRPLNIEECRIDSAPEQRTRHNGRREGATSLNLAPDAISIPAASGRWPSNVLLSDPEMFDEPNPYVVGSGAVSTDGVAVRRNGGGGDFFGGINPKFNPNDDPWPDAGYGGAGGYSRFFIVPKADRTDREPVLRTDREPVLRTDRERIFGDNPTARHNVHPTVKPVDLMRHLVRLVTPSGGTVLDPFLGSGSTAIAAEMEGFPWIGIEREAEYVAIAEARLNGTQRGFGLVEPVE
jgi:DNA modification methylase